MAATYIGAMALALIALIALLWALGVIPA
jgi:hypothetical protein